MIVNASIALFKGCYQLDPTRLELTMQIKQKTKKVLKLMRSHFHGGLNALHSKKKKQHAKDKDKNSFLDFWQACKRQR